VSSTIRTIIIPDYVSFRPLDCYLINYWALYMCLVPLDDQKNFAGDIMLSNKTFIDWIEI